MLPAEIKERVEYGDFYSIDFETYFDKETSLTTMGVEQYVEKINDDVYLVSIAGPDGFVWVGDPRDFDWQTLHGQVVCAHNMRFDLAVFMHCQRLGIIQEEIELAATFCTADLSVYFSGQRSLKNAARYFYDEDVDKGYRDVAKGMKRDDFVKPGICYCCYDNPSSKISDLWSKELSVFEGLFDKKHATFLALKKQKRVTARFKEDYDKTYRALAWLTVVLAGREDALMCRRIAQDYFCDWPDMEVTMSQMTREGGMKGVYIDQELLDKQIELCTKVRDENLHKLPWYDAWVASGLKTPTARRFVDDQCKIDEISIPASMNKADEVYLEWLDTYGPDFEWIDAIRKWNNAHKCLTTFETCKRRIREDGTMPFGLMYFGAHTGRWSGAQKYNMQNMLKKYREENHPLASIDARGIHIPRPGHAFIISDLGQIEWRVKNWLVKDWDALEICKTVHPYVAGAVSRGSWDLKDGDVDWLKENKPTLYAGYKMAELALQYGTGFKKYVIMHNLFGLDPFEIIGADPSKAQVIAFKEYLDFMDQFTKSKMFTGEFRKMEEDDPEKFKLHVCSWAAVKEWRELNPKTTAMWKLLGGAFERAVASGHPRYILQFSSDPAVEPKEGYSTNKVPGSPEFVIRLPNGRDLTYHKIGKTKDGGLKCKTDLYSKGKNAWSFIHGGLALENVTQALSRDVFAWHMEQLYLEGIPTLWSAHDELIVECLTAKAEAVRKRIDEVMCTPPPWMPGLVLGNDSSIADKYEKG